MSINLDHPKLSGETTVHDAVTEVAAMVGENVKLRRGFMFSTTGHGVVSSYLHNCPQPGAQTILFISVCQIYPDSVCHSSDTPPLLAIFYY
jgi:translation elongation factor EF-Ts